MFVQNAFQTKMPFFGSDCVEWCSIPMVKQRDLGQKYFRGSSSLPPKSSLSFIGKWSEDLDVCIHFKASVYFPFTGKMSKTLRPKQWLIDGIVAERHAFLKISASALRLPDFC